MNKCFSILTILLIYLIIYKFILLLLINLIKILLLRKYLIIFDRPHLTEYVII
jgi:hypothetical protein